MTRVNNHIISNYLRIYLIRYFRSVGSEQSTYLHKTYFTNTESRGPYEKYNRIVTLASFWRVQVECGKAYMYIEISYCARLTATYTIN